MAVIKRGVLGGFQNKIGNVVGGNWKGIDVMRSLPVSVANPRTASQVSNRDRFKACTTFFSTILATTVKPLWDRFAIKMSGYNSCVQANIANFDENGFIAGLDVIISRGKMASTDIVSVVADESEGEVSVGWTDDSGSGFKLATDEAYAIAFIAGNDSISTSSAVEVRSNEGLTMSLPVGATAGQTIFVCLAFKRADGTIVSNTATSSAVIVA